jgi:hypothetical protein
MEQKEYTINGKGYVQKPLVLGQIRLLIALSEGRVFNDFSPFALVATFSDCLPELLAIILTPEGEEVDTKDIKSMMKEFSSMYVDTAMEVAADFLSFRRNLAIISNLKILAAKLSETMGAMTGGTGSET